MEKLCFALDLVNDHVLITEYEYWHKAENIWPEIKQSIINAGIKQLEIYRTGNRLFMIMEITEAFNPTKKAKADASNPKVQAWEQFMWKFQQALPNTQEGEKWVKMNKIFNLN